MEQYTETKIISLNSIHASNKYNGSYLSDVDFNFRNVLKDDPNIIRSTIQIINCLIPVSYYTINYTNNTMTFYNPNVSALNQTITIERGNYNSSSLITALQDAFSGTIQITISRITGKLTFTSNVSFIFYPSALTIVLGFEEGITYTATLINGSYTINAPQPLNLLGIKKIKIFSDALMTSSYDSYGMGNNTLINTIPVNAPPFGMITYLQPTSPLLLTQKIIDTIDIQLRDENGSFINFNNVGWALTIQIDTIRTQAIINNPIRTITDVLERELQKIDLDIQQLQQPLAKPQEQKQNTENQQNQDIYQEPLDSLDLLQYNGQI
jgi:hypothetical protein